MAARSTVSPPSNLTDKVTTGLLNNIIGFHVPGDRLPSLNQLTRVYSASLPVIREAVARLEALGVLEVRHGDGTYVRAPDMSNINEALRLHVHFAARDLRTRFLDLMEFRRFIEAEGARLAAVRATTEDFSSISEAFDRGRAGHATGDLSEVLAADIAFHNAILNASHNSLLVLMNSVTQSLMEELRSMYPQQRAETASKDHERILQSILDRQSTQAAQRAGEHVEHVNREFSALLFNI
jgi:GntR family transcriptional repressor for pyruvate dehydrogenase complex